MNRSASLLIVCFVPFAAVCGAARPAVAATGTVTPSVAPSGLLNAQVENGRGRQYDKTLREIQRMEKRAHATYQRAIRDLAKLERARSVLVRQVRQSRQALESRQALRSRKVGRSRNPVRARKTSQARRAQPPRRAPQVRRAPAAPHDPILARIGVVRRRTAGSYRVVIAKTRELRRVVHVRRVAQRSLRAASKGKTATPPVNTAAAPRAKSRRAVKDTVRPRLLALRRSVSTFEKNAARERRTLARLASKSARALQAERRRLQERARATIRPTTLARRGPASPATWRGAVGGVDPTRRTQLAKKVKRDAERLRRVEKELRELERQVSKLERQVKRLRKPVERAAPSRGS